MSWMFLIIAGIFEIGWPLGFKLSQNGNHKILWILFSVASMTLSGLFLYFAQKNIPIGTAYAVWTGIGAAGTLFIGIIIFKDSVNTFRILSAMLIILGIVGLRLSN